MTKLNKNLFPFILAGAVILGCKKEPTADREQAPTPAPKATETPGGGGTGSNGSADQPTDDVGFAAITGQYKLDAVHSAVTFKIGHMKVSHTLGRFNKVDGTLEIGASPATSSISIEVAASSIFTADKKRDDHLRSPDFLNTAQYPTIKFISTKIEAGNDNHIHVTGDLTLHGVTKPISTDFELVGSGKNMMDPKLFLVGFTGELKFKRSDFGMTKMIGPAGDQVELLIAIEAVRQ